MLLRLSIKIILGEAAVLTTHVVKNIGNYTLRLPQKGGFWGSGANQALVRDFHSGAVYNRWMQFEPVGNGLSHLWPRRVSAMFDKSMRPNSWVSLLGAFSLFGLIAITGPTSNGADFARDVRPILSQYCFKCHGPDDATRHGGLRLDQRESALAAGESGALGVVPQKPDESELIRRILSEDPDEVMPPPHTKQTLTDSHKQILREWISEGAPYAEHWAFKSPALPPLPQPVHSEWASNAIDVFVLERLQALGLNPSAEAKPEELLRRVYLDLVGLPPSEAEVKAYLNDPSPNKYAALVERLMSSPAYGERWARRWLDLARYADTNGYEKDRARTIWPYRDWVINALNEDLSFDQFTIKQLAGDLLPNPTLADRVATGFHRNTMLNEEGGIDPLEFRYHAMVDRVGTTGTVWMGMSIACAQCHNHKYDPVSQKEYYQLMAYLNNAEEPELELVDESLQKERTEAQRKIQQWLTTASQRYPIDLPEVQWQPADVVSSVTDSGATLEKLRDGTWVARGNIADKDVYRLKVKLPKNAGWVTGVRLEVYADGSLPSSGPGRAPNGNMVLTEVKGRMPNVLQSNEIASFEWSAAQASFAQQGFSAEDAVDGNSRTGWALDPFPAATNWNATWHSATPMYQAGGEAPATLEIDLEQLFGGAHLIGKFKLLIGYVNADPVPGDIAAATRELTARSLDRAFVNWQQSTSQSDVRWKPVAPVSADANMARIREEGDRVLFAEGDQSKRDWYTLQFAPQKKPIYGVMIEALPDPRLPKQGPGRVYYEGPIGDFFLSEVTLEAADKKFAWASAEQSNSGGNAAAAIDTDPLSGWTINGGQGKRHFATFRLKEPVPAGQALKFTMLFERYYAGPLGKFRIWFTDSNNEKLLSMLPPEFSPSEEAHDQMLAEKLKQEFGQKETYFAKTSPWMNLWQKELDRLQQAFRTTTTSLVMQERPSDLPRATFIHHRGEFLSPKDQVNNGVPAFLPPVSEGSPGNRLDFAKWLVRNDHPLTARVIINRNWSLLMGRGLVSTEEDFGYQGSLPTHPALLDWLARQWVDGNGAADPNRWSMKWLHRMIVTSSTYKQTSAVDDVRLEKDPDNRWLSRGPRKRLEAEQLRDALLVVSGLLDRKMRGPSVFPPQPASVTTEGTYGQLAWNVSQGGERYRRGLYTFAKRTAPYAMFQTFDGPSGEACLAKRTPTNTPLQALTLLNDPVVVETSQVLGRWAIEQQRLVKGEQGNAAANVVATLFVKILSRQPDPSEAEAVLAYWNTESQRLSQSAEATKKLCGNEVNDSQQAAWVLVARALLNTDEFLTRN